MNIIGLSGLHESVAFKRRALPNLSPRQYRFAQGFDSAAALITSDGIQAAAAEERFTREKATGAFPIHALCYCLDAGGITAQRLHKIGHAFSYEPYRQYFLEQGGQVRQQFEEVFSLEVHRQYLRQHFPEIDWQERLVQVPHHMAHAASAYYTSGFDSSLILVVDGMGEVDSMSVLLASGKGMHVLKTIPALHSLGMLYSLVTYFLGFQFNLDEYKVMGLAPTGDASVYSQELMDLIRLKPDGTFAVPLFGRNKSFEERETYSASLQILEDMFGAARTPHGDITQRDRNIAAALQESLEATLLHVLSYFQAQTGQPHLCMAGGVALNCTANGRIRRSGLFDRVFVQPAAGDDGTALGAAIYLRQQLDEPPALPAPFLPFLGPDYTADEVRQAIAARADCEFTEFEDFERLADDAADFLSRGKVIGWYQGRMEFGPRALGNRSILADPRDATMVQRINSMIKQRESFRPFAPAVTKESAYKYFDISQGDEDLYAYMLFTAQVREPFRDKLPAVIHVDGSSRLQIVSESQNPRFWKLLRTFEERSGFPVLLNTSFNIQGEPIVCTPAEALATFINGNMDRLVIGNCRVERRLQPARREERLLASSGDETAFTECRYSD